MSLRGLLIGVIALAVLGGTAYWSEHNKKPEDTKGPNDSPKLVSLKDEDVSRVEIRRKDAEPVVVQKEKSGWQMIQPKPVRTDADAVSGVVSAMSGLTWDRLVEDKATDMGTFGLAAPAVQVTLTGKDNKKQTIEIGDETPTGGAYFAKLQGDPRVFSINGGTKSSLDKSWQDLRDKRLMTFDESKLSRVELAAKGQPVEFGRNGQKEWQIVKPKPMRADNWQVEELVRKLHDVKMETAPDADEKKLAGDFASATRTATVMVTDATGSQNLEVRKKGEDYLAKSSVTDGVYKIAKDVGDALGKSADDFRSKKLFDFGFNEPSKITMREGEKNYDFVKGGQKWFSNGKEMDPTSVQSFIDKLRDLSAAKFAETAVTTPSAEISVTSQDGKRVEKVALSKSGTSWFAKRENEPTVYELDSKKVEELQRAAADVKAPPPPPKK